MNAERRYFYLICARFVNGYIYPCPSYTDEDIYKAITELRIQFEESKKTKSD